MASRIAFDEWELFDEKRVEDGYSRAWFAAHGFAFELRGYGDGDEYGVVLYTDGCASGDEYDYEDADLAVFGREEPFEFIYAWPNVPQDAESVIGLMEDLMQAPYALEGIVLTYAGPWIEKLDQFKANLTT